MTSNTVKLKVVQNCAWCVTHCQTLCIAIYLNSNIYLINNDARTLMGLHNTVRCCCKHDHPLITSN